MPEEILPNPGSDAENNPSFIRQRFAIETETILTKADIIEQLIVRLHAESHPQIDVDTEKELMTLSELQLHIIATIKEASQSIKDSIATLTQIQETGDTLSEQEYQFLFTAQDLVQSVEYIANLQNPANPLATRDEIREILTQVLDKAKLVLAYRSEYPKAA